ncbi:hypothetical protein DPMN_061295 [Dreissena polymorpha]|uniref:B box-type domain-containing protein n=1 Tax=Dreissena polymorpha TaxID=45954 RepID=A0A9D4HJ17_DREPO|nr:hypothetical protein DPMN_061295 [Dreissena polymorpha]
MEQDVIQSKTGRYEHKIFDDILNSSTCDEDSELKLCDPCGVKHEKKQARNVCEQCENEFLCAECSEHHNVGKVTGSHILVSAEKFIETSKKKPKLCDPCSARNVKKEAQHVCEQCENEFLCSECSENHKVGKLTNTHILVSAEKFIAALKKETKLCDPCSARNVKKEAQHVCEQCENEFLCFECSENHKVGKLTSTHILVSAEKFIAALKKETELCDPCSARNVKKKAQHVCEQCENEFLCFECSENHKVGKLTSTHILVSAEKFIAALKKETKLCDPCSARNVKKEAQHVCEQCKNEFLCIDCSENHNVGKITKTHILVSAEKFIAALKKETKLCDPCSARNVKKEAQHVCQ